MKSIPEKLGWWLFGMIGVGVAGDSLMRATPWGLNLTAWVLLVALAVAGLFGREHLRMSRTQAAWCVVATVFGLLFAWRDSSTLRMLNVFAMLGAMGIAYWLAGVGRINVGGILITGVRMVGGVVLPLIGAFQVMSGWILRSNTVSKLVDAGLWVKGVRVLFGLAITAPVFLLFTSLFASADLVFKDLVNWLTDFDLTDVVVHVFFICLFTWLAAGIFFWLWPREATKESYEPTGPSLLGNIETGVLLTALNGLFLVFIAIQVGYLFGGNAVVQSTANLSYAEYFRSGFFELLAVAALVLPLLLICDWAWRQEESPRRFRQLAVCLLAQLGVVMLSAFKRLALYLEAYGLTEQRLYAAAILCWLAFAAVWLLATVLRGKRQIYAPGIVMAAFALLLLLNVMNPDATIAKHQLSRKDAGKNWDIKYLLTLSADAAPVLIRRLESFTEYEKARVMGQVASRWSKDTDDWRTSNLSRWQISQWKAANSELMANAVIEGPAGASWGNYWSSRR